MHGRLRHLCPRCTTEMRVLTAAFHCPSCHFVEAFPRARRPSPTMRELQRTAARQQQTEEGHK